MRTMLGTTKADDETCLSDSDPVAISTATIRVLVISIEPIVRIGVETVLAAQAVDGGRSIEVARPVDPCSTTATTSLPQPDRACDDPVDVVLYDVLGLHLTDGDDLDVAVRSHPGRVIALARALQPGLTGRALAQGAIASVPLGASADRLRAAICAIVDRRLEDGSLGHVGDLRDPALPLGAGVHLTPREQEVLALVVAGASNEEISRALHITLNTVKSFIRTAYARIGATTRAQAAAWGVEHGFPTRALTDPTSESIRARSSRCS